MLLHSIHLIPDNNNGNHDVHNSIHQTKPSKKKEYARCLNASKNKLLNFKMKMQRGDTTSGESSRPIAVLYSSIGKYAAL